MVECTQEPGLGIGSRKGNWSRKVQVLFNGGGWKERSG